jgi:hypothetical protein
MHLEGTLRCRPDDSSYRSHWDCKRILSGFPARRLAKTATMTVSLLTGFFHRIGLTFGPGALSNTFKVQHD